MGERRPAGDVAPPARHVEGALIGVRLLVDDRRVGPHGLDGVEDGGEHFVLDLDEREGLLGGVRVHGGDRGDLVPQVADLLGLEETGVVDGDPEPDRGNVPGGHDSTDAGQAPGLFGVDVQDPRVRVAAAEDGPVEHVRKGEVRRVPRRPRRLGLAVDPRNIRPHNLVIRHRELVVMRGRITPRPGCRPAKSARTAYSGLRRARVMRVPSLFSLGGVRRLVDARRDPEGELSDNKQWVSIATACHYTVFRSDRVRTIPSRARRGRQGIWRREFRKSSRASRRAGSA